MQPSWTRASVDKRFQKKILGPCNHVAISSAIFISYFGLSWSPPQIVWLVASWAILILLFALAKAVLSVLFIYVDIRLLTLLTRLVDLSATGFFKTPRSAREVRLRSMGKTANRGVPTVNHQISNIIPLLTCPQSLDNHFNNRCMYCLTVFWRMLNSALEQ